MDAWGRPSGEKAGRNQETLRTRGGATSLVHSSLRHRETDTVAQLTMFPTRQAMFPSGWAPRDGVLTGSLGRGTPHRGAPWAPSNLRNCLCPTPTSPPNISFRFLERLREIMTMP